MGVWLNSNGDAWIFAWTPKAAASEGGSYRRRDGPARRRRYQGRRVCAFSICVGNRWLVSEWRTDAWSLVWRVYGDDGFDFVGGWGGGWGVVEEIQGGECGMGGDYRGVGVCGDVRGVYGHCLREPGGAFESSGNVGNGGEDWGLFEAASLCVGADCGSVCGSDAGVVALLAALGGDAGGGVQARRVLHDSRDSQRWS